MVFPNWLPGDPLWTITLTMASSAGLIVTFWILVGVCRFIEETLFSPAARRSVKAASVTIGDVAVLMPAHNEEVVLPRCLAALLQLLPPDQIYVVSDGSSDRTVEVVRSYGCQVLDLQPNRGKARALQELIERHNICKRYKAVLIHDADSEISSTYFNHALPLFDDPQVMAVAGHVQSKWHGQPLISLASLITAYRTRLYSLLQLAVRYPQTWHRTNVSCIVPGFASMYRTDVLPSIDIAAPGLVIEDFNMTFELHRKRLGRIAYSPSARCTTEDPQTLGDYRRQVFRWNLGFWQTVLRHGIWPSFFSAALVAHIAEMLLSSLFLLLLPLQLVLSLLNHGQLFAFSIGGMGISAIPAWPVALLLLFADYVATLLISILAGRPTMIFYGLAFPFLRLMDAWLFIAALARALRSKSDGRWISPLRHASHV